ncbi:hypothetical protein GQ600_8067 [Phytophthora cactorum]|nr:hypothetical protein GQ600_8067 [Phytophthora cactorum]
MIHHTQRDIIDQAIREAESRMSIVEAENLVFERESIRCAASANAFDTTGNAVYGSVWKWRSVISIIGTIYKHRISGWMKTHF